MSEKIKQNPLQEFIGAVNKVLRQNKTEEQFLPIIGEAMKQLLAQDNWLDHQYTQADPNYYQQYLLYAAPDDSFSVVSFVWGPGQTTPIHDHTVWGIIGMLQGSEIAQNFKLSDKGQAIPAGEELQLNSGDIAFVSPTIGDIHSVKNASNEHISISIHIYGTNIGKVKRHVFPFEGGPVKEFISGYSN